MTQTNIANFPYGSQLLKSIINGHKVLTFLDNNTNKWMSQCLDYDIAGFGATSFDATAELLKTIEAVKTKDGLNSINPAPQAYQDIWDADEVLAA